MSLRAKLLLAQIPLVAALVVLAVVASVTTASRPRSFSAQAIFWLHFGQVN